MPSRPCLNYARCKQLIPSGSLCSDCQATRDEQRSVFEPWRFIYHTPEWAAAQRACLNRDGGQCRARTAQGRCGETQHLQAHHTTPLRDSWRRLRGDHDRFLAAVTLVGELVALCPRHHAEAERALRGSG